MYFDPTGYIAPFCRQVQTSFLGNEWWFSVVDRDEAFTGRDTFLLYKADGVGTGKGYLGDCFSFQNPPGVSGLKTGLLGLKVTH